MFTKDLPLKAFCLRTNKLDWMLAVRAEGFPQATGNRLPDGLIWPRRWETDLGMIDTNKQAGGE